MIPGLRFAPKFYLLCAALLVTAALSAYGTYRVMRHDHPTAPGPLVDTLYMEAKGKTDTVSRVVVKLTDRFLTDTLWRQDTVTLLDTLRVLVPLAQLDSTIRACSELATTCQRERAAAERVQRALRDSIQALQPSRFGCVAGVGVTANQHRATPGVGVTCGLRVKR